MGFNALPPFRIDRRLMPANNQVAVLGDSRAANGFGVNPDQTVPKGHAYWLAGLSRGALSVLPVQNFGIAGENTAQILARIGAAVASPAGIVVVVAGVNDPLDATLNATPALSLANLETIWSTLNGAGKLQIWRAESPRSAWQATPAQVAHHMAICNRIASFASRPGTLVFNPWPIGVDLTTGDWRATGFCADGVHPDASQALGESRLIWDMLKGILPPRMVLPTSGDDILSAVNPTGWYDLNFYFAGTGGTLAANATGQLATGWSVMTSEATLTAACSVVTLGNGQRAQRIVVSGTPTGASPYVMLYRGHTMANLNAGDRIQMWADFAIASGYSGLTDGPQVWLDESSGPDAVTGALSAVSPAHAVSDAIDMILPTPVLTVDNPKPANVVQKMQIPFKQNAAASLTIDVRCMATRKVG